jgi:mono/diheme cytochrome c family protein
MRRRSSLLVTIIAIALTAAACGRATPQEIDQLLGITPTATHSAEEMARATSAASATGAAKLAAVSSPGAAGLGDVTRGQRQFETWCSGCHSPGGSGPDILSAGSPGASVTADSLKALIRDGKGHTPPGPYKVTEVSDKQILDIAAYLRSSPGP